MTLYIEVRFFSIINELTSQYYRTELLGNTPINTIGPRKQSPNSEARPDRVCPLRWLNRFILEVNDLDTTNYAYNALSSGDH